VDIPEMVAHERAVGLDDRPARQERVAARGLGESAQGRQDAPGLDHGVERAVQRAGEGPRERGVEAPRLVRRHDRDAARRRVRLGAHLLDQRCLLGPAREQQRSALAQPDPGRAARELDPARPARERHVELAPPGSPRDPQQPEAAHGRAARLGIALDLHDLVPQIDRGHGERGADDAAPDDHEAAHLSLRHPGSDPARARPGPAWQGLTPGGRAWHRGGEV